jgi:hypothetical protein
MTTDNSKLQPIAMTVKPALILLCVVLLTALTRAAQDDFGWEMLCLLASPTCCSYMRLLCAVNKFSPAVCSCRPSATSEQASQTGPIAMSVTEQLSKSGEAW